MVSANHAASNSAQKYFCAVYDCVGKVDLSKGYWNPKRKSGVTRHFFRADRSFRIPFEVSRVLAMYSVVHPV